VAREIAPTQFDDHNHMLRGQVHDPTALRMGGVAGHAGLFSTPTIWHGSRRLCSTEAREFFHRSRWRR